MSNQPFENTVGFTKRAAVLDHIIDKWRSDLVKSRIYQCHNYECVKVQFVYRYIRDFNPSDRLNLSK